MMSAVWRRAVLILVCLVIPITNVAAAQFTADFNFESAQTPMQAKIYVSGDTYRLESQMGEEQMVLIHKEDATYAVNSALKQYKVFKGKIENFVNPIVAWENTIKDMQVNQAGEETLNGYQCKLYKYKYEDDPAIVMEIWLADALNFFVKQVFHAADGDAVMTLSNIKEGKLDPALFEIPADYTEAVAGQKTPAKEPSQAPESKASVESGRAPWGGIYSAGAKITVALDPEMKPKVAISNRIDGESVCKFTSKKKGKEPTTRTISLGFKSKTEEPFLGFGGTESVALEVEKGEVLLTVNQEGGAGAGYGEDIYIHTYGKYKNVGKAFNIDTARNLTVTITSDSPETVGNIKFFAGSYTDEIESEEFALKRGETRSWQYSPDKKVASFEVNLTGGAIRFSFRQPDEL
jgi:hypothetical protein